MTLQASGITAEGNAEGVLINMVPKDGGNVFAGTLSGLYTHSTLSGDNLQLHLNSRAYFLNYASRRAVANGLLPFYWDAGGTGNNGSAIFDRNAGTVFDRQALDALIRGANGLAP